MKLKLIATILTVLLVAGAAYALFEWSGTAGSRQLITYSADAYVQETNALLNSFSNSSGVAVSPAVGGGSFTAARSIGQGVPSDVFVSASLTSYSRSYLHSRYSGWAVAFGADQLVIAYSNLTLSNSLAKIIVGEFKTALLNYNSTLEYSAFTNLTSGKVKVGIANPVDDPAGLRGWLALEMAGYLFSSGNTSHFAQMLIANNANVSSTNAAELVAPLEAGSIQFLFIYKSAAIAKGLPFITLPAAVNQGDPNMSSFYSQFSYSLPSGTVYGSPIYLFITVLANSTLKKVAFDLLDFVVNNTQQLASFGMTPLSPSIIFASAQVPPEVAALEANNSIVSGGSL